VCDDNKTETQPQGKKKKKKFIVREVDASLLRRNAALSKNARHLHGTLRAMGDAKTGEVRIGKHWYTPDQIDREAEMSHNTRKTAMRELIRAGLAHLDRPRHATIIKERLSGKLRKHDVLGRSHYSVSPTPRRDWLDNIRSNNFRAGSTKKTRGQKASSIDQILPDRADPPKQSVSSIDQSVYGTPNGLSNLCSNPPLPTPAGVAVDLGVAGEGETIPIQTLSQELPDETPAQTRERLKKWASEIILKRTVETIRDKHAYLKTCLDNFFQNLSSEVETYLTEMAKDYVSRAKFDAPDLPISYLEITNYLDYLCDRLDLPLNLDDREIIDRILFAVRLANHELAVVEPCGFFPTPKWQTYRQSNSSKYPIPGWNESRTFFSGYASSSAGLGTLLRTRPAHDSYMAEMLSSMPN
jgi:hypothetical protein